MFLFSFVNIIMLGTTELSQLLDVENPTGATICEVQARREYRSGTSETLSIRLDDELPPNGVIGALTDLPMEGGVVTKMIAIAQYPCETSDRGSGRLVASKSEVFNEDSFIEVVDDSGNQQRTSMSEAFSPIIQTPTNEPVYWWEGDRCFAHTDDGNGRFISTPADDSQCADVTVKEDDPKRWTPNEDRGSAESTISSGAK